MHWLTLRFLDPGLERAFAESFLPRVLRQGQIAVWMGMLVYVTHGLLLDWQSPALASAQPLGGLWGMRWTAMLVPVLVLVVCRTRWFAPHCHLWLSSVGFAAGWGLTAMQTQVTEQHAVAFYPLMVEVAFYTYNFVGARFIYALGVDLTLLAVYNVVFGFLFPYPARELLGHDFFLFSANLIGGTAGYLAERQRRRLFLQTQELARTQARMRESEAAQARARILRDMHDGVGSHISTAIRQLESGRATQDDVLHTLRDSLDQLKLSIDAMNLPQGDITALLANLRYRLEPRLAASDIELQWGVDLLEPIERLDAQAMRQLQFMVLEALSNVLQHAQASVLRIEAAMTPRGIRLRLVDNGHGFDVMVPLRKGLQSMRERAQAIGATLSLHSAPGRTVVEILIP
ncbi:sensor histidine kinase [Polaromonas jejuensis]|uniref:histidine kinase n=1 Tax=Polaromonas jejuensis TaxID=457502 RepID=A0ABW0Q7H2_9BURK|nr:histidine kinase [Polaromonas jejuensis]